MKEIFTIERVYNLNGTTGQIRVKIFNKVVFKSAFKQTLNTI